MDLQKKHPHFYLFSIFHIGSVLIGMTITSRMILVNISNAYHPFYITGGIFFMPVAFFIQDIVTEVYGYYNARIMLHITLIIFAIYVLSTYSVALIPCKYGDQACQDFLIIAQTLPKHALSFIVSLAIGGTINNYILAKSKLMLDSKFLAVRFIFSTAIGEAFFQFSAVLISWYGTYSIRDILPLAIASYIYKILFEIIATPVNLYVCRHLKTLQFKE